MFNREAIFAHTGGAEAGRARVVIDTAHPRPQPVNPLIFGKFCEHLGSNIYNGMYAQILRNPTFGSWPFSLGETSPDGGCDVVMDPQQARKTVESHARWWDISDPEALLNAYAAGAAFFWRPVGARDSILPSPDVGPNGCRAQRLEVRSGATGQECGIGQQTYLPLHRTRGYEYRLVARAAAHVELNLRICSVAPGGAAGRLLAQAPVPVDREWTVATGALRLPADVPADAPYDVQVLAPAGTNVVLARVLLFPDDHMGGADPDVIHRLKEARLPLVRWPGGNFVSGYHWRDGIGPADLRPTLPNMAWGGLEYNLFGTDEFIQFCRHVGCEPMICVNAGNGTEQEAADWVEYCNGSADARMGKLRAANGHPEPYNIRYWEIGNELYGQWQISHTTPAGNADRACRFAEAMRRADPGIWLIGCGNTAGDEWNLALVKELGPQLRAISNHPLLGGHVDDQVDPAELYHAFMDAPRHHVQAHCQARQQYARDGLTLPAVAVTELQLFAHYRGKDPSYQLPTPDTITEALYDTLWFHECIRAGEHIEMLTHSATINHGGGLIKRRERVIPQPAHYGHAISAQLAGALPVPVHLTCATVSTTGPTGTLPGARDMPVLDAFAALSPDGHMLLVNLVHRSATTGPIEVAMEAPGFAGATECEMTTLQGLTFTDRNTPEQPQRIGRKTDIVKLVAGRAGLVVPPFAVVQVRIRRQASL